MTDEEIIKEFMRLEAEENRKPHGADYQSILHIVTAKSGKHLSHVRALVLDRLFSRPN